MSELKRLLFISDYPPSTIAGAPVIVRQLLRRYDPQSLHILCCASWHTTVNEIQKNSYLPVPHTTIPSLKSQDWRPRRYLHPVRNDLDMLLRRKKIVDAGAKIIEEKKIEAIFATPYSAEFFLSAHTLAKRFDLPFFVFETDEWEAANKRHPLSQRMIRATQDEIFRSSAQMWLTSPAMVREYERRFGVKGEFLFHFVDTERYTAASQSVAPPDDVFQLIYTGSINAMFESTMDAFCRWLNQGVTIDGRPVRLKIFNPHNPTRFVGDAVTWGGFVSVDEIAREIAAAHVAVILVSFTDDPATHKLIQTSLYTKTIDYLASGTPTLVVAPADSGEVDYFGSVTDVVDQLDFDRIHASLTRLVGDKPYRDDLIRKGRELVERAHSMEALDRVFLRRFRREPTTEPAV